MSKLTVIKQALESNPKTLLVGITPVDYLSIGGGSYYPKTRGSAWDEFDEWIKSQIYRIVVAPKNGLYTAQELQAFMVGLVPNLEPRYKRDFQESKDGLELGYLFYQEEIAKERRFVRREITLTDKETQVYNFKNNRWIGAPPHWPIKRIDEISHIREIDLRPYPNEDFARRNVGKEYWLEERISWEELMPYRSQLTQPRASQKLLKHI